MDEDYYEEVSDQKEVGPDVFSVADLVAVLAPLIVEVPEIPDNPESPSPVPSSPAAPPGVPSPPPPPLGDLPSFIGFFTSDDVVELEQWVEDSGADRSQPELRVEELELSRKLNVFLRVVLGLHWELCLLRQSAEVLFDQLRAYRAGYNQLISLNRRQWLRLFPTWTATERREQLEPLDDAGGLWVLQGLRDFGLLFGPSLVLGRRLFFTVSCLSLW